jgi:hypothetical protein
MLTQNDDVVPKSLRKDNARFIRSVFAVAWHAGEQKLATTAIEL